MIIVNITQQGMNIRLTCVLLAEVFFVFFKFYYYFFLGLFSSFEDAC